jgi:hypothetical protein
VVALPFTDAADFLGSSPTALAQLRSRLESLGAPVQLRLLDTPWDGRDGWTIAKRARWHRLAVTDDEERLWSRMSPAMRRAVRKAEREGVDVKPLDGEAGLGAFIDMHRSLRRRKYRLLAQPPAFFEAMMRRFRANRRLARSRGHARRHASRGDGVPALAQASLLQVQRVGARVA